VPFLIDRFDRHSHRRCPGPRALQWLCLSSGLAFEGEIQPENELSCKSKVPLFIDGLERHLHRRCPRLPALQLACLSSGRSLEGEIAEKRTELQEQSALAY
jgi:hypothetical protein